MLKKNRFFVILACVLLLAINVTTVLAAPLLAIHIEVLEWIGSGSPEPFSATGPAVANGLVCATGMVEDLAVSGNNPGGPFQTLWVVKRFNCDDTSGTFDVKMVVKLDNATHDTTANWKFIGGTGNYVNLKGNGKLVGISNYPVSSILDIYDGKVH